MDTIFITKQLENFLIYFKIVISFLNNKNSSII